MSGNWSQALVNYAKQAPESIAKAVYVTHDDRFLTIQDLQAALHWLILPRIPFTLSVPVDQAKIMPKLDPVDGSTSASKDELVSVEMSATALASLSAVSKANHRLAFLHALQAYAIQEQMRERMQQQFNRTWPINVGFHAAESMAHVHVHVVSVDLCSPHLKNKSKSSYLAMIAAKTAEHYNSFRPDLGFFLHLDDIVKYAEQGTLQSKIPNALTTNAMLKKDLVSFIDHQSYANLPKLKDHLQLNFDVENRKAKKRKAEQEDLPEVKKPKSDSTT